MPTTWRSQPDELPAAIGRSRFVGCEPVGLDVEGVVPQVDAAGGEAEGDEGEQRLPELGPVVEDAGRAGGGEHEQVLRPLQRSRRANDRAAVESSTAPPRASATTPSSTSSRHAFPATHRGWSASASIGLAGESP